MVRGATAGLLLAGCLNLSSVRAASLPDPFGTGTGAVVVATSDGARLVDLSGTVTRWSWSAPPGMAPSSAQVFPNPEGGYNVLVQLLGAPAEVYCLNGADGSVKWHVQGAYAASHEDAWATHGIYTDPVQFPNGPPDVGGTKAPDFLINRRSAAFGGDTSHVICVDGDTGAVVWDFALAGDRWASGFIPDVNQDGYADVVVRSENATGFDGLFCVSGQDGSTILWQVAGVARDGVVMPDVTGDGVPDFAVAGCCFDDRVLMLDGTTGATFWQTNFGAFDVLGAKAIPGTTDLVVAAQGSYDAGGIRRYRGSDGQALWSCDSRYNDQIMQGLIPTPEGWFVLSGWRHQGKAVCVRASDGRTVWDTIPVSDTDHAGIAVPDQDEDGYADFLAIHSGVATLYSTASGAVLRDMPGMNGALALAWMPGPAAPEVPQGKLVYWISNADGLQHQIRVTNLLTGTGHQVPLPPMSGGMGCPLWWPDATRSHILFSGGYGANASRVFKVNEDGSDLCQISDDAHNYVWPSVDASASTVACHAVGGSIYTFDAVCGAVNPVELPIRLSHVRISPDGRYVAGSAYVVSPFDDQLYVYDRVLGDTTQVSHGAPNVRYLHMHWSPDSSKIVSSRSEGARSDIVIMDRDGANEVVLTAELPSAGGAPTWSADGGWITFASDADGSADIWAMRPDGSGKVNLTRTPDVAEDTPGGLLLLPPDIATQPVGLTVSPGSNAQFSVSVTGSGPFTFQWQRDGADIPGATNRVLFLRSVTRADEGSYRVIVRNGSGQVVSAAAVLDLPSCPVEPETEFGILTNQPTSSLYAFDFDGRFVVWRDVRYGDGEFQEIFAFDLLNNTEIQVSSGPTGPKWNSVVSGGVVAWYCELGSDAGAIYVKDLTGRIWASNEPPRLVRPISGFADLDLDGDWLVWSENYFGGVGGEIYALNLRTDELVAVPGRETTFGPATEWGCHVTGDYIVYTMTPGHVWGWDAIPRDWDVVGFNLRTRAAFDLKVGPGQFTAGSVSGDLILLGEVDSYGSMEGRSIHLHNLRTGQEQLVATNASALGLTEDYVIYGDVFAPTFYILNLHTGARCPITMTAGQSAAIAGYYLVWQDRRAPGGEARYFIYGHPLPAKLEVVMCPRLEVYGPWGASYCIESNPDPADPKGWVPRTNIVLEASPCVWIDVESAGGPRLFYRASQNP